MPARKEPIQNPPTIPPERALRAIKQQLERLEALKGRMYDEADSDETKWKHVTESIIEGAFGKPSTELSKFYSARSAGYYNMRGISPQQRQQNFQLRTKEFEALLQSLIEGIHLRLPEEEIKGVYDAGEQYEFYRDLSSIIQAAKAGVLIVDAYLGEDALNLYLDKVPGGVPVRLLTNKVGQNVEAVARMYAKSKPLELRSSADIHDRTVFVDQRGWVIGQSIKDAGKSKPTYMIELEDPSLTSTRDAYERIWKASAVVV